MATTQIIYGLSCTIPDLPSLGKIDGNKLPVKKQKFRRVDWESELGEVDRDGEDKPIYTDAQIKFIDREFDRCTNGHWFMKRGVPTYLTGKFYYYLTYWFLENNILPEYRESDRLFFIFFEEAYDDPQILGICRLKNRRLGATSMGTCISVQIATFGSNKNCGNISKTDDDAVKMFQDMIVKGFFKLPEFLRPRIDNSSTNKKKLHFIETPTKGKRAGLRKIEGLQSVIDYEATTLGSYDSTRQSFMIVDESGKWQKVNINSYLSVVKECVSEGARKKGFLYFPTTVNPPKEGGTNFKIFWDTTNHFKYGRHGTPKKIIRYFQPSWECLGGFIDEYGDSVVDPPDKETLSYMVNAQLSFEPKERIPESELAKGAKKYLEDEFDKLTNDEDRDDFKRKFPFVESDSFSFGSTTSPFNMDILKSCIAELEQRPVPLRRGDLYPDFQTKQVSFSDNSRGNWLILKLPKNPNQYTIEEIRGVSVAKPLNSHNLKCGVDTFRNDKTVQLGSNGVIVVGSPFDSTDDESGMPEALFVGRPKLTEDFWKEILMACMFWGAKANVEKDATQEYKKYFNNTMPNLLDANCNQFLLRTPDAAIDDNRKTKNTNRFDFGVASSDPFVFAKQIELAAIYIQKYCWKIKFLPILYSLRDMDLDARTKSDEAIGFMVWLLGITGETKARKAEAKRPQLIQTYRVGY